MLIYPINDNSISEGNMTVFRPFKEISNDIEVGLVTLQNLLLIKKDQKNLLLLENNYNYQPEDPSAPLLN